MRVLQVITSLQTGGAETLVVQMIPRFRKSGIQVDLCLFNGEETPLLRQLKEKCPEIKVYKFGKRIYNPWYIWKLYGVVGSYDIVHTHNTAPQLFAAISKVLCSVVARRNEVTLVTTEHNTSNRRRGWRWYRPVDKWMYSQYRKVICISNQAEENLRSFLGRCNTSIETIFNGIDVKAFHDAPSLKSFHGNRFVVVMVAGFRYQKDQDTLLRAMQLLPQDKYELWLVGDGNRRSVLEQLMQELCITDCVHLLGLRTDVPNILKSADVVVMSSHWEGLSLSNIEGMSAGKPFIASDVDGLREVTKGYGLLFPHGDATALAALIAQLHDDKNFYDEIADRCYERAKQFDISKTVAGYMDVYKEVMME